MNGMGLDLDLDLWFEHPIPSVGIPKDYIRKAIKQKLESNSSPAIQKRFKAKDTKHRRT